jgi:hypothetical protein
MLFVYKLTLRQLSGRWRLLITLLLTALPVVMAVVRSLVEDGPPDAEFEAGVVGLLVGVILPLVVLAIASAAFTNEIEDRTLANLTLTPIPRWKIVVPKLLGAISVAVPFIATSVRWRHEGSDRNYRWCRRWGCALFDRIYLVRFDDDSGDRIWSAVRLPMGEHAGGTGFRSSLLEHQSLLLRADARSR